MLTIVVPGEEHYDETENLFSTINDVVLDLEHSLASLSKWESKFQKPFLSPEKKTTEETFEYIRMMILTPSYPPEIFVKFTTDNLDKITEYIDSKQSATTFGEMPKKKGAGQIITSELIYYWMATFGIPFECQYWHLNRLFALIRICNVKNSKPKPMSRNERAQMYRDLNAQRRAQLGTKG